MRRQLYPAAAAAATAAAQQEGGGAVVAGAQKSLEDVVLYYYRRFKGSREYFEWRKECFPQHEEKCSNEDCEQLGCPLRCRSCSRSVRAPRPHTLITLDC